MKSKRNEVKTKSCTIQQSLDLQLQKEKEDKHTLMKLKNLQLKNEKRSLKFYYRKKESLLFFTIKHFLLKWEQSLKVKSAKSKRKNHENS